MAEAVGNIKKGKALKYPCLRCKKNIKKEQRSVQCQTCQLWVHVSCQEISDELFKILVEPDRYGGVCWNCDCCMASAVRLEATVRAFETRVKLVEDATAKTANDVKIVNTKVAALRREFEEERRRTREALENRDEKFVTKEELREREARKLNVILHRVKEAGEDLRTGEERRNHDTEECGKIFRALHLEEEDESNIKHCRRIGEASQDPGPLVVVLKSEETKRKLLESAKNLRGTDYQEIGIVPDLTLQQRNEEQQMVAEVDRRNEEDLTEDDRAKNLRWRLAGPKGAKRIIKGTHREQTWRGTMRRGRGRGQITTGANAAPLRGGAALRGMGRGGAARLESTRLLPPLDRTRLASKRNRDDATAEGEEEEEEETEEMESAEEESGETRSPPRKK